MIALDIAAGADVLDAFAKAFAPREPQTHADFAESNIVIPASVGARPGPLKLVPYQKAALDFLDDPTVHTLVLRTGAQCGKSTLLESVASYYVVQEPSTILVVQPTDARSKSWSAERFLPMCKASPALREAIIDSDGANNATFKQFDGGFIALASSYQPDSLAARACRVVIADEVDRWALSAGREGSPLALAKKRQTTFGANRKTLIASTPVHKATSVITQEMEKANVHDWVAACRACGTFDSFHEGRLYFPPNRPEEAKLVCTHCGDLADEAARQAYTAAGHWELTQRGQEGVIGLQLSELASPFSSLKQVALQVHNAVTHAQKLVVQNVVWGLPSDAIADSEIIPTELQARAVRIEAPYPSAVQFITAGVDVQVDRVEMTTLAHCKDNIRYVLDHNIHMGDTTTEGPWRSLEAGLARTFKLDDKREVPYSAIAIDSGYSATRVYDFAVSMRAKGRPVYPIKGVSQGWSAPTIRQGQRVKGRHRLYIVSVDPVKAALQRSLNQLEADKPNYIHLPAHLDPSWYEQLGAERLVVSFKKNGQARYEFVKVAGSRNEALDALAYADAIASLVKQPARAVNAPKSQTISVAERIARMNAATRPN